MNGLFHCLKNGTAIQQRWSSGFSRRNGNKLKLELQHPASLFFRLVHMFARRQAGVFLKMLRAQRLGNHVPAAEPFAGVNQLAAVRTKRAMRPGQPVAFRFANRIFNPMNALIWFRLQWS
jgi:hypothetical protein